MTRTEARLAGALYWGGSFLCAISIGVWLGGVSPGLAVAGLAIAIFPVVRGGS